MRRTFGDRRSMVDEAVVSTVCDAYVCPRRQENVIGQLSVAWPAVIWTCLSVPDYIRLRRFRQFFTEIMRRAWRTSMPFWSERILEHSHIEPVFKNLTSDIENFDRDIDTAEMGRIQKRVNDTAYPIVRCSQGCSKFIDDLLRKRIQLILVVHYLGTLSDNFRSFDADPSQVKGIRPGLTERVCDLD